MIFQYILSKIFSSWSNSKKTVWFLIPTINSSNSSNFLNTPYFFAIAQNKDATFSPRFYTDEKILLQTEFRQANKNSYHITDFSYFNEKGKNSKIMYSMNMTSNSMEIF